MNPGNEYNIGDDVSSASNIAEQSFANIPVCLRVRMAMDVLETALTSDEFTTIEAIVSHYLDEAFVIERDFDYDTAMGIEPEA